MFGAVSSMSEQCQSPTSTMVVDGLGRGGSDDPRRRKDDSDSSSKRNPSADASAASAHIITNPQPRSLFPPDEHIEIAVQEAEEKFLQGDFRRALKQSNRILVFASNYDCCEESKTVDSSTTTIISTTSDDDDDEYSFRPPAPLHFPFVLRGTPLYIRIDFRARNSNMTDRVAAVALQSWYELYQMDSATRTTASSNNDTSSNNDDDNDAASVSCYRFLEPFWQAYSAETSHRSCSLELVLVLIQFCHAMQYVHEATELALATLHHVFNNHESYQLRDQAEVIQELLIFLFRDTLPYCQNDEAVTTALSRFKEAEWSPSKLNWELSSSSSSSTSTASSPIVNSNATKIILLFLENPPVHWPDEFKSVLGECQCNLDGMIEDTEDCGDGGDRQQQAMLVVPMTGTRDKYSGRYSFLPTLGWDGSFDQWLCRFLYLARVCIVQPLVLSERRWENRAKTTVAVWTLWMGWRQRKRLYRGSKYALMKILLKPLIEIVDAFIPRKLENAK